MIAGPEPGYKHRDGTPYLAKAWGRRDRSDGPRPDFKAWR